MIRVFKYVKGSEREQQSITCIHWDSSRRKRLKMLLGNFRTGIAKIVFSVKCIFKYKDSKELELTLWTICGISIFKDLVYKKAYIVFVQKLLKKEQILFWKGRILDSQPSLFLIVQP